MTDSVERQVATVLEEAIARRDPALPRWAIARATRLLRELEPSERDAVVERLCDRPNTPPGVVADLRAAAQRAAAPAPTTPETPAAPAPAPSRGATSAARPRRSTVPQRGVQARTFKGRTLADVPHGTRVEYQGKSGVVEPPWLVLDDGRRFQFLNPAAVYVNGGVDVSGWDVWKVSDGRSLAECYESGNWPPVE